MVDPAVKPRRYDGDGRRRAAAERRLRVLKTAVEVISTDGYVATTMAGLAQRSGVSVEYLYKTFGDKPRLTRQLLDFVLAGDDDSVAVDRRAAVQEMIAEPDARVVLALYAARCAQVNARSAPLLLAMAAAAPADADLAAVVATADAQRLGAATAVTANLASKAALRSSPEEARDAIWTLDAPEVWDLVVRRRGWSAQRYATWLTTLWVADVLAP